MRRKISFKDLPVIDEALACVKEGVATGASERNWKGYGAEVSLPKGAAEWQKKLMSDPQTSGGLLVACAPDAVPQVMKIFQTKGFAEARVIGRLSKGPAQADGYLSSGRSAFHTRSAISGCAASDG